MKKKYIKIIAPATAVIVGIALVTFGFINLNKHKQYGKTTAKIDEIQTIETVYENADDEHIVFVSYTVNNNLYRAQLTDYSSELSKGDEVEVRYNKNNPEELIKLSYTKEIVLFTLGAVCLAVGCIPLIKRT